MGPLVLPSTGLVYLDTSSLIYSVERVEPYRTLLEPMWQGAQDGNLTIVSSPVLVVEALVKPIRDGNTEIEMQYRELFCALAALSSSPTTPTSAVLRAYPSSSWTIWLKPRRRHDPCQTTISIGTARTCS